MAGITYNSVDIRGEAAEPIFEELLFENSTLADELVTFEDDVKAETIFTEASAEAVLQAYTSGQPTAKGGLNAFDVVVTPQKGMFYDEFDPEKIRFSRFKRDMKAGAWETLSNEFERVLIGGQYSGQIAQTLEAAFWNGVKPTTKTAVDALTAGTANDAVSTAEKALVAASPESLFDGVVQTMIYNTSNAGQIAKVGGRVKVVGTTITASNIKAEYDKIYAAIPAVVLNGKGTAPFIYVPRSHKQMINIYNNNPENFKDAFSVSADKSKYFFNGVEIKFVPLPENVMIAAKKENLVWCTDLKSDYNQMKIDKIANNQEKWFLKNILTIEAHVGNQTFNVLYVG
ncbi:structural protein [Cellulophaga phage phi46:1]|uniref:structural protein n=1 Tax=Cellulophaga phage phi46:1 TaxID=1327974 RepID=UPI00035188BE|nr:structural protein [Cellulophaga phage phi46:1]AGO47814.1 structural protein [Cellulophaga phage phi46:1]